MLTVLLSCEDCYRVVLDVSHHSWAAHPFWVQDPVSTVPQPCPSQSVLHPCRPPYSTAAAVCIVCPADPQGFSLINLVRAMAGNRPIGAYTALRSGYCNQQPLDVNVAVNITNVTGTFQVERAFTNNLQVNCTGRENYINRIWLNIGLTLSKERANNEIYMPGTLPTARDLTGLRQLTELGCISCGLAGTLPRDWGTEDSFMELRTLDFTGNNFTGTLPETWGYMGNLERLTLSSLNLTQMGRIPAGWGHMRSLRFANFSGLYVDNSTTPPRPCAPWQWATVNALIWNQTLLPPANFPDMVFCNPP